jgi:DNA-binding transcriptional regulator GbsR (MarR family)
MRKAQERREPKARARDRIDMVSRHPELLLEYTTFIDKKTVLVKRHLVPKAHRREIEETFDSIEELRNRCAHPDSSDEPFEQPKELLEKVLACHGLLAKIKDVLEPIAEELPDK